MKVNKTNNIYGVIYLLTNKINKKKYVGQTTYAIEKRWNGHLCKARNKPILIIDSAIKNMEKIILLLQRFVIVIEMIVILNVKRL